MTVTGSEVPAYFGVLSASSGVQQMPWIPSHFWPFAHCPTAASECALVSFSLFPELCAPFLF